MAGFRFQKLRDGAKKMVAKTKVYGKKKTRDLASRFLDLTISPSKPGTSAVKRALAPTPDSQDDALLKPISSNEGEGAAESEEEEEGGAGARGERGGDAAEEDGEDKENRPRRKARVEKPVADKSVKKQTSPEISELTSLAFVDDEVADFQDFCKGWEKTVKLTKIGQGSYATVLKMELNQRPGEYSVWKLMPLKPSAGVGSRPRNEQTLIKDAVTEVRMLYAMSDIDGFVQFRSAHVVEGLVPEQIRKAHESWAKDLDSDDMWFGTDMSVEYPSKHQLWLLMEMTDAGQDLDVKLSTARLQKTLLSVEETWDIFWGVAEALMRGEAQAEFEHRDLHPGNICIKQRDEPLDLTTEHGVPRLSMREVTLIDYTQSRLTVDSGDVLANAVDESIFRQNDADPIAQRQYNTYRDMRDVVKMEKKAGIAISQMWGEYVPTTNVLWLHYILAELSRLTKKEGGTKKESDMVKAIERLESTLVARTQGRWEYNSACEIVFGFIVTM